VVNEFIRYAYARLARIDLTSLSVTFAGEPMPLPLYDIRLIMKPKKAFFASQADLAFKREIGTYGVNIRQWEFGWHNRLDRHNRGERRIMPDVAWFSSVGRVGPGPSCATLGGRDFWTGVEPRRRVQ